MAGDLGSESGAATLNLMARVFEKVSEALMKLLNALYILWKETPQRKAAKANLKEAETKAEKIKIIKKMQGVDGYIRAKRLEKYCDAINQRMIPKVVLFNNEDEKEQFIQIAKSNGLAWSATQSTRNTLEVTVLIPERDLDLLNKCIEQTEDLEKIKVIEQKETEILNGRTYEECSDIEKNNLDLLRIEKATIRDRWEKNFNTESYNQVLDDVMYKGTGNREYEARKMSFEYEKFTDGTFDKKDAFSAALDANTFKSLNKDRYSVVVSLSDPDRYIICHGEKNPDKMNKHRIITTYEVHNSDGGVRVYDDFSDDWKVVKERMRQFGGFGGKGSGEVFYRFGSVEEFQKWQKLAIAQRTAENVRNVSDAELKSAIDERLAELSSKGYELKDGVVYDITEKRPVRDILEECSKKDVSQYSEKDALSFKMLKTNLAEAILIGKQIENYNELIEVNSNLAASKTNLTIAELNGDKVEIENAQNDVLKFTEEHDKLEQEKLDIVEQRNEINGLQADIERQMLHKEYELSNKDMEKLNDISVKYESLGLGDGEELKNAVIERSGKERVEILTAALRKTVAVAIDNQKKGEKISDYEELGSEIARFSREQIERIKNVEPDVFRGMAYEARDSYMKKFEMSEKEIAALKNVADKYEELGLGNAEEFMESITSKVGNERIAELTKHAEIVSKMIEHSPDVRKNELVSLEIAITDIERKEAERNRQIYGDTIIYGKGAEREEIGMDKDKHAEMKEYSSEIDTLKKEQPVMKKENMSEKTRTGRGE